MMDWLRKMFGKKQEPPAENIFCHDQYPPTEAQRQVAQRQEQLRDEIRIRALQANVDILRLREQNQGHRGHF